MGPAISSKGFNLNVCVREVHSTRSLNTGIPEVPVVNAFFFWCGGRLDHMQVKQPLLTSDTEGPLKGSARVIALIFRKFNQLNQLTTRMIGKAATKSEM